MVLYVVLPPLFTCVQSKRKYSHTSFFFLFFAGSFSPLSVLSVLCPIVSARPMELHQMWPCVTRCDQLLPCVKTCQVRPDVTCCDQMWPVVTRCDQLWPGVTRWDRGDQMWPEVTGVTSCEQMWQGWPDVTGVARCDQCDHLWPVWPFDTRCDQLWPLVTRREARKSSWSLPSCLTMFSTNIFATYSFAQPKPMSIYHIYLIMGKKSC